MSIGVTKGLTLLRLITKRMLTPSQEFELWFWGDLRPRLHPDYHPERKGFAGLRGKRGERRIESIKNKLSK